MAILSIISISLRVAQFITATVVLGLTSYFLHEYDNHSAGNFNRLIYSAVISAISVCLSFFWTILPHATWAHIGADLIFCAAWFAVFGLLQSYYDDINCGDTWAWGSINFTKNYCGQWNATQAFSFLAAIFWFASFIVALLAWSKARHSPVVTDDAPAK